MIDTSSRRTRTIAVISTNSGRSQGSQVVSSFLRRSGYEVISVKPAQTPVVDLASLVPAGMLPGSVDAVVIFRRPDAMPVQIREVAEQEFTAVWLPPGTWRCAADADAQQHHLVLVMT
ncbi:MAG TPA: CoA-binding protein [Vicinamibacterales bacterium]